MNEILNRIIQLELEITTRRIADAIAGNEESPNWLANKRAEIAVLRAQL